MRPPAVPLLTRAALALYPPSWRARYGDEVRALLEDSGSSPAAVASVAWRALPAWFWPPRHLHDRPARMRASLATALVSWSMLAGLGLVFAQLTQLQALTAPGHPEIPWAYYVFDVALAASVLAAGFGGLPLWLLMLRRARREQRIRDTVYLFLPVIAPVAYLLGLIVTTRLIGGVNGVSPGWFGVITVAGFAAAGTAAAGPAWPCAGCSPRGQPCAWPRPRPGYQPQSWRSPPWPSWSPWPACSCGDAIFPGFATPPCPGSTWHWSSSPPPSRR